MLVPMILNADKKDEAVYRQTFVLPDSDLGGCT